MNHRKRNRPYIALPIGITASNVISKRFQRFLVTSCKNPLAHHKIWRKDDAMLHEAHSQALSNQRTRKARAALKEAGRELVQFDLPTDLKITIAAAAETQGFRSMGKFLEKVLRDNPQVIEAYMRKDSEDQKR